jgi:hypothetical protein
MKRIALVFASILLAYWVTVDYQVVMGPWEEYSPCASAANDYGISHGVFAICQYKNY